MAKKGTSRMRVFFAELEGDDDTMQTGLKAIAAAVNKTFEPRRSVIYKEEPLAIEGEYEEQKEDIDDVVDAGFLEPRSNGSSKKKRPRKPPSMRLVQDLDLKPDGKQSLRSFFEDKSPAKQWSQIVVFVYYLEKILKLESITPHHVYSCFKDVEKRAPKDVPQAIRSTSNRHEYIDSSDQDHLRMTVPGENFVEHDLPGKDDGNE